MRACLFNILHVCAFIGFCFLYSEWTVFHIFIVQNNFLGFSFLYFSFFFLSFSFVFSFLLLCVMSFVLFSLLFPIHFLAIIYHSMLACTCFPLVHIHLTRQSRIFFLLSFIQRTKICSVECLQLRVGGNVFYFCCCFFLNAERGVCMYKFLK
jgi:hypothetical protein